MKRCNRCSLIAEDSASQCSLCSSAEFSNISGDNRFQKRIFSAVLETRDQSGVLSKRQLRVWSPLGAPGRSRKSRSETAPRPLSIWDHNPLQDAQPPDLDYNRGHLVATQFDGLNNPHNVAPMMRQLNQGGGAWRNMEAAISRILTPESVEGESSDVGQPSTKMRKQESETPETAKAAPLNASATIDQQNWYIEIDLYYDWCSSEQLPGEWRIPVAFYITLTHGARRRNGVRHAHWLLENWCVDDPAIDELREKAFYYAHWNLALFPFVGPAARETWKSSFGATALGPSSTWKSANLTELRLLMAVGARDQAVPAPPYRALQWLLDEGSETTGIVPSRPGGTAFSLDQILIIRQYNRWRNGGVLRSDARIRSEDEEPDVYEVLSMAADRGFPEVDHIVPQRINGAPFYENARLVSTAHNHIYKDKPVAGSKPLTSTNLRGKVKFSDADLFDGGQVKTWGALCDSKGWRKKAMEVIWESRIPDPCREPDSGTPVPEVSVKRAIEDRIGYLRYLANRQPLLTAEGTHRDQSIVIAGRHQVGVMRWRQRCTGDYLQRLIADFGAMPLTLFSNGTTTEVESAATGAVAVAAAAGSAAAPEPAADDDVVMLP